MTVAAFLDAWGALESTLITQAERTDSYNAIEELLRNGTIDRAGAAELHDIRRFRNLYGHRNIREIGAAFAIPSDALIHRVNSWVDHLSKDPRIENIMNVAITCDEHTSVKDVLSIMKLNDFDMVPYRMQSNWFVFSRVHLAMSLEQGTANSTTNIVTLDTSVTVAQLVAKTGYPLKPIREFTGRDRIRKSIDALVAAPSQPGTAPMLLIMTSGGIPHVLTVHDLPVALSSLLPPS